MSCANILTCKFQPFLKYAWCLCCLLKYSFFIEVAYIIKPKATKLGFDFLFRIKRKQIKGYFYENTAQLRLINLINWEGMCDKGMKYVRSFTMQMNAGQCSECRRLCISYTLEVRQWVLSQIGQSHCILLVAMALGVYLYNFLFKQTWPLTLVFYGPLIYSDVEKSTRVIVAFSTETLLVMWPNLFTVWHSVGADGLVATLGSKKRAHKTLFTNQYKGRTT